MVVERWCSRDGEPCGSEVVDKFLDEIELVCRRFGLCIAHEDCGGSFIVEKLDERFIAWLKDADIGSLI